MIRIYTFDGLKKTDRSIEIYDQGIKLFPDYYQLYFNKGVSLSSVKKYDEAAICFQYAAILNPEHGSSHNAIARIAHINNKRIPALLAYCRFLALEPQSNRGKENLLNIKKKFTHISLLPPVTIPQLWNGWQIIKMKRKAFLNGQIHFHGIIKKRIKNNSPKPS